MRSLLIILLLPIFLYSLDPMENEEALISSFRETLINQGSKFLDKTSKESTQKPHELIVDLRNPSYKNGILVTHEGGVIKGEDIRIQARTIQYIQRTENNKPVHKIEAEGDLIIQYKGRIYVGNELEYDFITRTGTVYEGKTFAAPWFLGGDKIELKNDGSYRVENVFITTCENADSSWDIHAGKVNVFRKDLLEAKKVRFRLFKLPTLWLPSFKVNLKKFFGTPLIRYKVNWDKSSGPRGSLRYRLYSWREFALFGRVDYRLKKGWGGAVETEYYPDHGRTTFETKNYLATDILPKDLKAKRRYRIQGAFHSISPTNKTKADLTWDKFSDINMPSDFKSDDFEINTAKRTELTIRHQEDNLLSILYARPRVNSFDTIKQDIPSAFLTLHPIKIPVLNIISYNYFKTSYMSYAYSDKLSPSLNDFHSGRLETHNELSRPFHIGSLTFTPYTGLVAIFYNNSPTSNSKTQKALLYGASLKTSLSKNFERHKHVITPYVEYQGITKPSKKIDSYYIFSIQDGYNELNLLKTGIRNELYSLKKLNKGTSFMIDFYTNTFIGNSDIPATLPKVYLDFAWNLPSVYFKARTSWNTFKNTLDYSNFHLGWTINENVAFSLEFRYRSSYDWRKSNHQNFILDVSRKENILNNSPLSDKRNTILTHAFFRLNPYWTCHLHSHHGFNRKHEPPYNEYKIDLFTMLSSFWKVRVSYQHTQTDDRFTGAIFLIK